MRPNILLFIADQHRWDSVGSSGRTRINTPNIDSLAGEGAFFENAFTPIPVCAPARQALLSGRTPESFGALWNNNFIPTPTVRPDPAFHTAVLKEEGYSCGLVGKWNSSQEFAPVDFGFSEHIDNSEYYGITSRKYPGLKYKNKWFGEPSPITLEDSKTHWQAGKACELIGRYNESGSPWFVRVDIDDPHLPCRPSEPFASMYDPDDIEPWESFGDPLENKPYIQQQQIVNWNLEELTWDDWKSCVAAYRGMVSQVDDAFGKILAHLKKLGIYDDTIIIYTTDHGDLCGGHGMLDKHYVLYDDVTRVPLVIRWPEAVKKGIRIREFVSNCLDMGATIADLCNLQAVEPAHGRSWVPLLKEEHQPERNFAVSSSNGQQFGLYTQRSIRTEEWLYVWNMTDIDELYDVRKDPGQWNNLISDPTIVPVLSDLRARLANELIRREDPFVKPGWLRGQLFGNRKLNKPDSRATDNKE